MKWLRRCEYGHINSEKKKMLLGTLAMIGIGVGIFLLGLLLNEGEKTNVFTIVGILFVLPMARYLTALIVLLPYKTPEEELYQKVKSSMPEGSVLFSDYVFTSGERVMGMAFFVLTDHEYIGLVMSKKEKVSKIQEFLSGGLKLRGIPGKVVVCTKEEEFLSKLKKGLAGTKTEEEREELLEFLRSLAI